MVNSELSKISRDQIWERSRNGTSAPELSPTQERFRACNNLIKRAKSALANVPEFRSSIGNNFFSSGPQSVTFSLGTETYTVDYYMTDDVNTEESISVTIEKEKIRLHTYSYEDGRVYSAISYYDDAPEFKKDKYLAPEPNYKEALRMVEELERLSPQN